MQTGQFGNMLLLDDDPNLADSDKPYTEVTFIIHESHIQSERSKGMKQYGHQNGRSRQNGQVEDHEPLTHFDP